MEHNSINELLKSEKPWEYSFEKPRKTNDYGEKTPLERYFIYKAIGLLLKQIHYKTLENFDDLEQDEKDNVIKNAYKKLIESYAKEFEKGKEFCKESYDKYGDIPDCDSSYGDCELANEVYEKLWCREEGAGKGNTFLKLKNNSFEDTVFGGDTMNSVQTSIEKLIEHVVKKKKKDGDTLFYNKGLYTNKNGKNAHAFYNSTIYCLELYKCEGFIQELKNEFKDFLETYVGMYHTLGNFVLVPAYFNWKRAGYTSDFWDSSLAWLKNSGFVAMKVTRPSEKDTMHVCYRDGRTKKLIIADEVEKEEYIDDKKSIELFEFDKKYFVKYINYFFLWDYVEASEDTYMINPLFNTDKRKVEKSNICNTSYWSAPKNDAEASEFMKNATAFIRRRGIFMTAMLKLSPQDYKTLQGEIFSKDEVYKSFEYVIEMVIQKVKKFQSPYDDIIEILKKSSDLEKIKEELQAENVR